jgi:hypothetical protein
MKTKLLGWQWADILWASVSVLVLFACLYYPYQ